MVPAFASPRNGAQHVGGARGELPEGLHFEHVDRGDSHKIMAMHPEHGQIGQLTWFKGGTPGRKRGEVDGIEVDHEHQRQGVASAMWEHARNSGIRPKPVHSSDQTDEGEAWAAHVGLRHIAYGETIAPPKVNTLRDENCPICGEDDAYDGHQCSICGYVAPPSPFNDPDLGMASRVDLRQQQDEFDESMMADPNRMAEDQQGATLICDNCGTEFPAEPPETVDTDEPAPDVEAEETELGEGTAEGDVCPACGQGILQAQDDVSAGEAAEGEIDPDEVEAGEEGEDPDADGESKAPFDTDEEPDEDDQEDDEDEKELPGVAVKSSDGPQDDDEDDAGPVKKKPFKTNR